MSVIHKNRVVVTGLGCVSPLGNSRAETWNRLIEGCVPAQAVRSFDASGFGCDFAYEVEGLEFDSDLACGQRVSASTRYGLVAAHEALCDGMVYGSFPENPGLYLGVGMGSPDYDWYQTIYRENALSDPRHEFHDQYDPGAVAASIASLFERPCTTVPVHTACASSGQAIGEAFHAIQDGDHTMALVGGADSMVNPYDFAGFSLLGALTQHSSAKQASRPFDRDRCGFVLGEGAAFLVFETLESALARGVHIYAEVCGYGITQSAYRITDLEPDGRGPRRAMYDAVQEAGIEPSDVGYINAHGTSTKLNDRIEAESIQAVFGEHPWVSSTKSMTGHLIAAAGAIEAMISVLSIHHQVLPPSVNLETLADECPIRPTPPQVSEAKIDYALSNSIGFGGSNTSLVFGGYR